MSDLLDFAVSFTDIGLQPSVARMNDGMAKVTGMANKAQKAVDGLGATAQRTMRIVGTSSMGAGKSVLLVGDSAKRASGSMSDLGSNAKAQMNATATAARQAAAEINKVSVAAASGGGAKGSRGGLAGSMMLGNLGAMAVMKAGQAVYSEGKEVMTLGENAGKVKAQYGVLAGEKQGAELYKDLTKFIVDSVFGPELYKEAVNMMGNGIGAKDIVPSLKMLGDVGMGDAEKTHGLAYVYAQTKTAGKLTGQDLMQYTNAGFNPLQEMSRTTGKSMADLREQMSDGKISFDMVRDAFKSATSEGGKFYHMLDKMADTPFGKRQMLEGNVEMAKTQLGESLLPLEEKFLTGMTPFIEKLPGMLKSIEPLASKLYDGFVEMGPGLHKFGSELYHVLSSVLEIVGPSALAAVGNIFEVLGRTLHNLAPLFELLAKAVKGVLDVFNGAIDTLKYIVDFGSSHEAGEPTYEDLVAGKAHGKPWGGYEWNETPIKKPANGQLLDGQMMRWMGLDGLTNSIVKAGNTAAEKEQAKRAAQLTDKMKDASDNVVNGGPKVLHIHLAPGTVKNEIKVGTAGEAKEFSEGQFRELLMRAIYRAKDA